MPEEEAKPSSTPPRASSSSTRNQTSFFSKLLSGSSTDPGKKSLRATGMGVYITLLAVSIISLLINNYVSYQPTISLLISIVLGFVFYISVHYTPEPKLKILLVIIATSVEVIMFQGLLALLPEWAFKDTLIAIHVFVWVILAVVLFFMGLFDALGSGQVVSKPAWGITILIFAVILTLGFPVLLQNPLLYQQQTHSDYYSIATEQVRSAGTELKKVGSTWGDYFSCLGAVMVSPTSVDHATCLKEKEIIRTCSAQFEDAGEREQCVQDQKSGKKNVQGVADQSRGATKFEFTVDDTYFQTDSFLEGGLPQYQVNVVYTNARKQQIPVTFSCQFEGRTGEPDVNGVIKTPQSVTLRDKLGKVRVACQPENPIHGKYDLIIRGEFTLTTGTDLVRFFVGTKSESERQQEIAAIEKLEGKAISAFSNSVPDPDPAWLSFGIGNVATDPVIVGDAPLEMAVAVENKGKGELVMLNSYSLEDTEFSIPCARSDQQITIPEKKRKLALIQLKRCEVESYPAELQNPPDYERRSFHASMTYTYALTFTKAVEISSEEITGRIVS